MEDALTLKVMRLRRPQAEPTVMVETPKLLLPTHVKESLVGEPFTGYLHLANHSAVSVTSVVLRVELQIGSSRFVLFDNGLSPVTIEPGAFFETDAEHELQDEGTYVLTCHVSYFTNEPCAFKRSYRFTALQPFVVVHRFAQLDSRLLVECVVENTTGGSIYLTSAELMCPDGEASLIGAFKSIILKPRGAHNLIFSVVSESDLTSCDVVGSLSLGWRVTDGPSGCTVTPVKVKPVERELSVHVVSCPRQVQVEVPFQLEVEVVNRSAKAADAYIHFDGRGSVKIHGLTQRAVGMLEPSCTKRVTLDFQASVPGIHPLRGITLVDELTQAHRDLDAICDIIAF